MDTKLKSGVKAVKRLRELLTWSIIAVGVLLILASLMPFLSEVHTILLSFGLSLVPAGVVTLILTRYASSITEMLLRETVETTIRDRIKEDMKQLGATVENGMANIALTVKQGVTQIEHDMHGLSPLFSAAAKLGLENVHLTRGIALTHFAWFLEAEVQKAERGNELSRVWIVSSSIKGFLEATAEYFDGRRMMEHIAHCGCGLRIMMTDPKIADLRAKQERRADGEIAKEVEMNLAYLKRIGVKREAVRYYPGTPTVFAIATSDRMLLNPYPYQTEAFRCFSAIVQKTLNPDADIFHQYLRYHFEEPWERTTEIAAAEWDKL
ncbi:hypothetical protein KKG05_03170 [bacterium]|nr:hypothetical protein [bacterium]